MQTNQWSVNENLWFRNRVAEQINVMEVNFYFGTLNLIG